MRLEFLFVNYSFFIASTIAGIFSCKFTFMRLTPSLSYLPGCEKRSNYFIRWRAKNYLIFCSKRFLGCTVYLSIYHALLIPENGLKCTYARYTPLIK